MTDLTLEVVHVLELLGHQNADLAALWPAILHQVVVSLSRQVGALPQSWQNVCLPRELTEVRRDRIDYRQDGLDKSGDEPWILVTLLGDVIAFLDLQERVEDDDNVLDLHLLVSLTSLL